VAKSIVYNFIILQVFPLHSQTPRRFPEGCRAVRQYFYTKLGYTATSMNPVIVFDLNWVGHPRAIASALLRSGDSAVLIDPGPSSCVATLREQLARNGMRVSDLTAILLTHIHLDHAGSTGTLVRENPNLQVYVHEKGAPHMNDPVKLLHSATRLYGDDMTPLFGEFLPVPAANLQALRGGEVLPLAGRKLRVLYTPGHASHHVTYFDSNEGTAFVGDTAGLSAHGHRFILPATPPPDISLELWDTSLDAVAALHPQRLFLTHFSYSNQPAEHIANYRGILHHWSERVASILASGLDEEASIRKFSDEVAADAARVISTEEFANYEFTAALNLSWMGLLRYHRKRAAGTSANAAS
jgi:glyoxylase-like metal-dependent hydrolase (beta-lactamase superfamily II)